MKKIKRALLIVILFISLSTSFSTFIRLIPRSYNAYIEPIENDVPIQY